MWDMRAARNVAADLGQFGRGTRQVLAEAPEVRGKNPGSCTSCRKTLLGAVPGAVLLGGRRLAQRAPSCSG